MQEKDYLLKVMDSNKQIRIFLSRTTRLVEEAQRRHLTSATASAALGRVLTAAVMMGSELKGEEDMLTVRFNGDGPGGTVIATSDAHGHVRGLIGNPLADTPSRFPGKLAVGDLVGKQGYLEVVKDMGLSQPFVGRVPLVSGEIAEDLAQYYVMSEQIPALVSLGVLVAPDLSIMAAGGLIVQAMPGANDELIQLVEKNILTAGAISNIVYSYENLEDVLPIILNGIDYMVLEEMRLEFRCTCNRERIGSIIAQFSAEEISQMPLVDRKIEAICNFCNEQYLYSEEEISSIKKQQALDS